MVGFGGVVVVTVGAGARWGPLTRGRAEALVVVAGSTVALAVGAALAMGGGGAVTTTVTVVGGAAPWAGPTAGRPTTKNAATAPIASMLTAPTIRSSALDPRAGVGMVAATPRVVGSGTGMDAPVGDPGVCSAVMVPVLAAPGTAPTITGTCPPDGMP